MPLVEFERYSGVVVLRMNRPERLNALNTELRTALAEAWCEFRDSRDLEVAIITGAGRAFCAGEDMQESIARGAPGFAPGVEDPFMDGNLNKPVIAAVNGYAMGGGFLLVERTDLRAAVQGAVFEMSEAKRWLLGGVEHGLRANVPHPIATEMAFAYRFTADRLYELGFINKLVDSEEALVPAALDMARHLLALPPASRVNTLGMMRAMRPALGDDLAKLAARLHEYGAKEDLMESRRAFAEKRMPRFKGWNNPEDRDNTPTLDSLKAEGPE